VNPLFSTFTLITNATQVTAPERANIDEGQKYASDSHQTNENLEDSRESSVVPDETVDRCGSSDTKGAVNIEKVVFRIPDENSGNFQEPVKRPVSLFSFDPR
jgi:hypothetical protein